MYASETTVSVEKTRAEIEKTVMRYGAKSFMSGWEGSRAIIGFEVEKKLVRFILPLPDKKDRKFTIDKRGFIRADGPAHQLWEQACRQRWRALFLVIKAKLEAVECKISTFEHEFLANIVMPDGQTIGERFIPQLPAMYEGREMPRLLPA